MRDIMEQATFVHRPLCELCASNQTQLLFKTPFTDASVCDFLLHYYEGRIKKELLIEASYEVREYSVCNFIWQAFILADNWIDAESSLRKKRDTNNPLGYLRQAERKSGL